MSRCYTCCQENCGNRKPACDCDCHATKRWAVSVPVVDWPNNWVMIHYPDPKIRWLFLGCRDERTIFTSLRLARAVALVTGGKVYRVKS